MALTCQAKVKVYPDVTLPSDRVPIRNQFEAWVVAETLREELDDENIKPKIFRQLHGMAIDLAEWLERQAA